MLAAVLALTVGTASAWHAAPSGSFACVVADDGLYLGMNWSVSTWSPGDLQGENGSIVVEMSRDGGGAEVIGTGAFTAGNGSFGGSMIVPEGPGNVTLTAYATAPWGDGTVDETRTSVDLYVPTIAELNDPDCVLKPTPKPTPEETPTPAPTPEEKVAPTPEETPTPEEVEEVTKPAPKQPKQKPEVQVVQPEAAPRLQPQVTELARTGVDSRNLALVAFMLIGVGTAILITEKATRRPLEA